MPRGSYNIREHRSIVPIGPSIAYIPLTRGLYALVDAADAEPLSRINWFAKWDQDCRCFYAGTNMPKESGGYRLAGMHSVILGVIGTEFSADHIVPGNGLDNRRCNLRAANSSEQARNHRRQSNNTSGHRGVSFARAEKKWKAYITHFRKRMYLGTFATLEEAAAAYAAKARELHGEFARLG